MRGETSTSTLGSGTSAARDVTITAIRTTPINIPLEAPYRWSVGVFPGLSKTIVEVETSAGVVGIGEAPSPWAGRIIDERIAPRLIGADPTNLADCERRGLPPVRVMRNADDDSVVHAFGGVEMALWDAAGKLEGPLDRGASGRTCEGQCVVHRVFCAATRAERRGRRE